MRALLLLITSFLLSNAAMAENISSIYTKLDFKKTCVWEKAASEEEAQMGGSATCQGLIVGGVEYPIYFAEGDLRQFVGFGHVSDPNKVNGGFAQWNSINTTIEWRLENGKPFATILRWFIDNIDPDTSSADPKRRGNVLIVSTVAKSSAEGGDGVSCPIGYIDARANKNANALAIDIADKHAKSFKCGDDEPRYYGNRESYSGTPNQLAIDQRKN